MFKTKMIVGTMLVLLSVNAYSATFTGVGDPISDPALSGGVVETFDAGPAGEQNNLTLGNVTYRGMDGTFTIGNAYIGDYNTRGIYSVYNGDDGIPANFRFDFGTPVQAFGFNWGAADVNWVLNAYNSDDVLLESYVIPGTQSSNAGEYFGISALNIAYATLVMQGSGDYVFIDNFTYSGEALPVAPALPVPALSQLALILMALMLAVFGYRGLRRKA